MREGYNAAEVETNGKTIRRLSRKPSADYADYAD